MAQHVVGAGGLLDPEGTVGCQGGNPVDRLPDIPDLIGVDHEEAVGADLLPQDGAAPLVVGQVAPDLDLEIIHAEAHRLAAEAAELVRRNSPASRPRWCRRDRPSPRARRYVFPCRADWPEDRSASAGVSASLSAAKSTALTNPRRHSRRPGADQFALRASAQRSQSTLTRAADHQIDDALLAPPAQLAGGDELAPKNTMAPVISESRRPTTRAPGPDRRRASSLPRPA